MNERLITFLHQDAIIVNPGIDPTRIGQHYARIRELQKKLIQLPSPSPVSFEVSELPDGSHEIHLKEQIVIPQID